MVSNQTKFKNIEIGPSLKGWQLKTLGGVLEITSSKRIFMSEYVASGVPFYRGKEITEKVSGETRVSTPLYITEERFKEISEKFGSPKENDILVGSVGTLGTAYMVGKDEKFYFKDGNLTWFRNFNAGIEPKYILYWLRSPVGQQSILTSAIGSTQPALTIEGLKKLDIAIPPEIEQKRIVEILISIDDKIELNRKINVNLEKLASTLFKKWFVDIGDKLPERWKTELMTDYVDIDKGLSYKGSDLNDDGENVLVGLKCFERGGGFRIDGVKRFSGEFKKQHLLNCGDLIVAMTDLTQGAEVLGKPAIVPNMRDVKYMVASLDISILRPRTDMISRAYLYLFFMRQETQDYLFGFSNGSTVLHLSIEGLRKIRIIIPPEREMKKFNEIIEPIFDQMQVILDEGRNLERVRDSLLPRLMSGKIRTKI